jgi:hypothetical protein
MIVTALVDITLGLSAGGLIYLIIKTKLFAVSLSIKSFLTFVQAVLGIVCLTFLLLYRETQNKGFKLKWFMVYYYYTLVTSCILPIIDLSTLIQMALDETSELTADPSFAAGIWLFYIF